MIMIRLWLMTLQLLARRSPALVVIGASVLLLGAQSAGAGSAVVVRDDVIRIGDIFPNAGSQAETIILRAPAPGERTYLDARWLARAARAYGITWHPADRDGGLSIERASQTVPEAAIRKALSTALSKLAGTGHVEMAGRIPSIHLAVGANPSISIESVDFEWDTRRFSSFILVSAGDQRPHRARVAGTYYETSRLPVLRRPMAPGEIITAGDIEHVVVRGRRLPPDTIADLSQIEGKTARRTLRAGEPVRLADIQEPMHVTRKGLVTLIVQTPYLTISTQGRALEDGALGDTVQVTNAKSGKQLLGTVIGPDTVMVNAESPLALSSLGN